MSTFVAWLHLVELFCAIFTKRVPVAFSLIILILLLHNLILSYTLSMRADDKVTVLESEKRAWENSPEAQAIRDALNPWKDRDAEARKES